MSGNQTTLPEDLQEWLGTHELSRSLSKNIARAFSDGVLVAEIVSHQFPKLVQLHNYSEQNTLEGKRANWQTLNKKVLNKIRCALTTEQIDVLCQWQSIEALTDFLLLLKLKLAAFEPVYLSQIATVSARAQEEKDAQRVRRAESKRAPSDEDPEPPAEQKPSAKAPNSHAKDRSTTPETPSRNTATSNPRTPVKRAISAAAAAPACVPEPDQIDEMYAALSARLSTDLAELTLRLDELELKSAEFDAQVRQQRQKNLEELRKTEQRVALLLLEQREIEQGSATANIESILEEELNIDVSQPPATEFQQQISDRSLQRLAQALQIREEDGSQDSEGSEETSDSDDEPPPPPPPPRAKQSPTASISSPILSKPSAPLTPRSPYDPFNEPEATHRAGDRADQSDTIFWVQIHDLNTGNNYFANAVTGATQWEVPTAGIIKCRDHSSERCYFIDAATNRTAWSLQELGVSLTPDNFEHK